MPSSSTPTGSASCRPPPKPGLGALGWVCCLPPPPAANGAFTAISVSVEPCLAMQSWRRNWVCSLAQLQPPFPSKSRLSCYLPFHHSSPATVSWICPFFPARISTACPQPGLGLGPGGLCLACQSLLQLCGAWACPRLVLPRRQLHSPHLSFAGGRDGLWAPALVGCGVRMLRNCSRCWCRAGALLAPAVGLASPVGTGWS